jgi:hypothetical protein
MKNLKICSSFDIVQHHKKNYKGQIERSSSDRIKKSITPEEEEEEEEEEGDGDPLENFMQALLCLIRFILSD